MKNYIYIIPYKHIGLFLIFCLALLTVNFWINAIIQFSLLQSHILRWPSAERHHLLRSNSSLSVGGHFVLFFYTSNFSFKSTTQLLTIKFWINVVTQFNLLYFLSPKSFFQWVPTKDHHLLWLNSSLRSDFHFVLLFVRQIYVYR